MNQTAGKHPALIRILTADVLNACKEKYLATLLQTL